MEITDLWNIFSQPQIWPFFLVFLGGYVMMSIFLGRKKVKALSELEKIIIGFGIGLLFWICFFMGPTTLVNYWFGFVKSTDVAVLSAAIFCIVSIAVLPMVKNSEPSEGLKKSTSTILFLEGTLLAIAVAFFTSASSQLQVYPNSIFAMISDNWINFIIQSWISLILCLIGAVLVRAYIMGDLASLDIFQVIHNRIPHSFLSRDSFSRFYLIIKRKNVLLLSIILPIVILVAGFSAVPIDNALSVFTPHIQKTSDTVPSILSDVVYIDLSRQGTELHAAYSYYRSYQTTYFISQPKLPWGLKTIYLTNPSNASFWVNKNTGVVTYFAKDWPSLDVNLPPDITYQTLPINSPDNPAAGLQIFFNNSICPSFYVNMTYYQKFDFMPSFSVIIEGSQITPLQNGTWLETIHLKLKNNSDQAIMVPGLTYNRLEFANQSSVYNNGSLFELNSLLGTQGIISSSFIGAHGTTSVTINILQIRDPSTY